MSVTHRSARHLHRCRGETGDAADGFTLVQVVLLLAVLALAAGLLLPLASQLLSVHRTSQAREQLERVKAAMVGERQAAGLAGRESFGFLGDIGRLPDSLPPLIRQGGLPNVSVSPVQRLGAGWDGPYYPLDVLEDTAEALLDPFGHPLVYRTGDTVVDGITWDARIVSAGPDGTVGTEDDLVVPIREDETTSAVTGKLIDFDGTVNPNADMTLSYRRNGTLIDTTLLTDSLGRFTFVDVPFGTALLRVLGPAAAAPDSGVLELMPGTQATSSTGGQERVAFDIFNTGQADIVINSIVVTYQKTAFYRIVESRDVGQGNFKTLFDAEETTEPWPGSGDTAQFQAPDTIAPVTASQSPVALSYRPLVVAGPVTALDTLIVPPAQLAGTTIRLRNWRGNSDGSGSPESMSGVELTITFNDGSTMTFVVP